MNKIFKLDWILITAVALLLVTGLVTLYSISTGGQPAVEGIFFRQLMFAMAAVFVFFVFIAIDYHYFRSYSTVIYFSAIAMLILVLFIGEDIRGTTGRWINLGLFNFQPVEIVKIFLVISLASFFSRKKARLSALSSLIASLTLALVIFFLIFAQPDLGSSIIMMGIWIGMVFFSEISKKYLATLVLAGILASTVGWFFMVPYQKERVVNFINPEADPLGGGYNVIQSIVAVGSGGVLGKGIGQGSQSQLNFLPEKHTDFIFAVIVEELGLAGATFVLILFSVILYRMKKIAEKSSDNFGYLIVSGFMIVLFMQIAINIGMNIGVMPVTGITLPFLSYGGSSLISVMIIMGITMSIHLKKRKDFDF